MYADDDNRGGVGVISEEMKGRSTGGFTTNALWWEGFADQASRTRSR
jgi:hypothetical protein